MSMSVMFRADASHRIGSGHVMRCLTLGTALRKQGAMVSFVCRDEQGHLGQLIEQRGFRLFRLPAEPGVARAPESVSPDWPADAAQTRAAVTQAGERPAWFVVDHYGLDAKWERAVRGVADRILVIDDLANRAHDCDLLLDQNLVADMRTRYRNRVPPDCSELLGPDYALLHPAYAELHRQAVPRSGPVRRLLIFFGGADRTNLTGCALAAVLGLNRPDVQVDVVVAPGSPHAAAVEQQAHGLGNVRVHHGLPTLAPLIAAADLAIGATGSTTWERLCLGLPAVVVTLADNQRAVADELHRRGLVRWLGDEPFVDQAAIAGALDDLLRKELDPQWSERCLSTVDGRGTARVCAPLTVSASSPLQVRHVTLGDEVLLLGWANDPTTRRQAFSADPIAPATHSAWLRGRLSNPGACRFYVVETADGIPIGQVRFDRGNSHWEIDYALAPAFRKRGLGRRLLEAAIQQLRRDSDGAAILGRVKPGNVASRKVFESLGFVEETSDDGTLEYRSTF